MTNLPYPGLRPFEREEADIFFGREEHTDQLLQKLDDTRFISVVGLSGCGKSSLVRAGMIAALETGYMATAGSKWRIATLRPGSHPLFHLATALLDDSALGTDPDTADSDSAVERYFQFMASHGPLGLVELLRERPLPGRTNLLILVDQFEEIFRYHQQEHREEAEAFVSLLLNSAEQHDIPIYVVITMRSDFIGDCALFRGLPEMLNAGQFLVPRLTREQQRMAILGPARVFGGDIEPRLLNRLLDEMGTDPDQLPLLQHCLMRLWLRAAGQVEAPDTGEVLPEMAMFSVDTGLVMTLDEYETIGGLGHALSSHADEAFEELDTEGQRIAEILFRRLSERGAGLRDTRRPTELAEISRVADAPDARVVAVVEAFRRADRCFLTPPAGAPLEAETMLDISHESLIRQWERLTHWVAEEAESAEMYQRLEKTARRWQAGRAALWTTPDLELALKWQQDTQPTPAWANRYGAHFDLAMQFLDASRQAQAEHRRQEELAREEHRRQAERDRQRSVKMKHIRRQWRIAVVVVTLLAIALVMVGNFWIFARKAEKKAQHEQQIAQRQRARAEQQERLARSSKLAAQAQVARFDGKPQRSLLLALEALNVRLRKDEPRVPFAEEVLRETLAQIGGHPLLRLDDPIDDLAFSPDGQWLAIVSKQEKSVLYRLSPKADSISKEGTFAPNSKAVTISPDSHWLITGDYDNHINFYTLHKTLAAQEPVVVGVHEGISDISVSSDGRWMLTKSEGGSYKLWELKERDKAIAAELRHRFPPDVTSVAISSDSNWLIAGNHVGTLRFYRVVSGLWDNPDFVLQEQEKKKIAGLAISADTGWFVTQQESGLVHLWRIHAETGESKGTLLPEKEIQAAIFSPDNHWLITGHADHTVRLWNLHADDPSATPVILRGLEGEATHLAVSADSQCLIAASTDKSVRQWNLTQMSQGATPRVLHGHTDVISTVAISSDNQWLATGSQDSTARVWKLKQPYIPSRVLPIDEGDVYVVALTPDGQHMVTGTEEGIVRLWDMGAEPPTSQVLQTQIWNVVVSANGQWLVTSSETTSARLWNLGDKDLAATTIGLLDGARIFPIAISSDARWLMTMPEDATGYLLWDVAAESPISSDVARYIGQSDPMAFIFSTDSQWLVIGSTDGMVRIWDLTQASQDIVPIHSIANTEANAMTAVSLSPDKRWLAIGWADGNVRLLDLTRSHIVEASVVLRGHTQTITAMTFSPDSRLLISGSADGTVREWLVQLEDLMELARQTAGRDLTEAEKVRYLNDAGPETDFRPDTAGNTEAPAEPGR